MATRKILEQNGKSRNRRLPGLRFRDRSLEAQTVHAKTVDLGLSRCNDELTKWRMLSTAAAFAVPLCSAACLEDWPVLQC